MAIRLLFIDDDDQSYDQFRKILVQYNESNSSPDDEIRHERTSNVEDTKKKLPLGFDCAIVDMKLGDDDEGGNEVIEHMRSALLRIPVITFTGHPTRVRSDSSIVLSCVRGEHTYWHALHKIRDLVSSGIIDILGCRGEIEEALSEIFLDRLIQSWSVWASYANSESEQNKGRTKKALLRHVVNHLSAVIDEEVEKYLPEEYYLKSPETGQRSSQISTGSIVKRAESDEYFVVLNPACDLVTDSKGRKMKTDRYLLVMVEYPDKFGRDDTNDSPKQVFLPENSEFRGGLLKFSLVETCSVEAFKDSFNYIDLKISQPFLRNIIGKFSAYYSRQGQPDIDWRANANAKDQL